jgi:2',3'-cyclic-nucleotide 2'-phosphodiesterase
MKILIIGDVFGRNGREILFKQLNRIKKENNIDFTIVNGENVTHGKSISYKHYLELINLNIDVITMGNHIFNHDDVLKHLNKMNRLLVPLNYNPYFQNKGTIMLKVKNKVTNKFISIRVTNLMGRVFIPKTENPYFLMDEVLKNDQSDIHIVDFHGEATAEKIAFAFAFDGKISALVGTHTHVQTADQRILRNGTAFITDIGMTGAYESIIGADINTIIEREKFSLPKKIKPSLEKSSQFCAVVITFDDLTNKVKNIERIFLLFE